MSFRFVMRVFVSISFRAAWVWARLRCVVHDFEEYLFKIHEIVVHMINCLLRRRRRRHWKQ